MPWTLLPAAAPFPGTVLEGGSPAGYPTLSRLSGAMRSFSPHLISPQAATEWWVGSALLTSGWEQGVGCTFSDISYPGLPPCGGHGRPDPRAGLRTAQPGEAGGGGGGWGPGDGEVAAENPDPGPWPGGWLHPYFYSRPPPRSSPEGKHGRFSRPLAIFRVCYEPQTLVEHSLKRSGSPLCEIKGLRGDL